MIDDRGTPKRDGSLDLGAAENPHELDDERENRLTRRRMIELTAGAVVATPLVGAVAGATAEMAPASGFFTAAEKAMVEELTELVIPADDHSPGARAAGAAAYIDARLAESGDAESKKMWKDGLQQIDKLCMKMHSHAFMEATQEQRVAALTAMAQNELKPKTAGERFFRELKRRTVYAYYTSEIGIHKEMEYKGNVLLKEFAGYEEK